MPQTPNFNEIVLLSGFSTYSDRKIFFYSSYTDYVNRAVNSYNQTDINFNPNDGIDAVVDLSSLAADFSEAEDIHQFSYLLVLDPSTNDIVSRWYIMDAVRLTNGIYRFTLKRDVVAESLASNDFVEKAPIYIEKGHLVDTDPMIVNSEGMSFNQIKKREELLKDPAGWGYIVGYMANSASVAETTISSTTRTPSGYYTLPQIESATGISSADLVRMISGGTISIATSDIDLVFGVDSYPLVAINHSKAYIEIPNSLSGDITLYGASFAAAWSHAVGNTDKLFARDELPLMVNAIKNNYSSFKANLNSVLFLANPQDAYYNKETYESLEFFRGKIVYYDGNYYTIGVSRGNAEAHPEVVVSEGGNTYFDNLVLTMNLREYYPDWQLYINYNKAEASISLTPVNVGGIKYKVSASHNVLRDAPYSMFVIPYGDNIAIRGQGNVPFLPDDLMPKEDALRVACSIAEKLGNQLYDLQLLPYLPEFNEWITEWTGGGYTGKFIFTNDKTIANDFDNIVTSGGDQAGIIMYMKTSNFSFQIPKYITHEDEMKIESQCNFYRLCSPNYNGVFEFNLAKNGGEVKYFLIDATYKPVNPFIRVTPEFDFLYGQNFLDGRGLICGGDFSLPVINDAWINYELNNKNYGMIFAREIQNLDVGLRQERFKEPFAIGAGIVGGGVAGGVAGSKGGAYGAIAGAAVGLGAGIVGGALDARLAEERRAETKDYAIDRFNLSLANIKALPDSLAKNSAFNITNKIFPFIEYYTCTDEEKEALRNKIKYDGMTVGRIGVLTYFKGGNDNPRYFKGQLIRAEGITEDDHFVRTLYNELAKGVYI